METVSTPVTPIPIWQDTSTSNVTRGNREMDFIRGIGIMLSGWRYVQNFK